MNFDTTGQDAPSDEPPCEMFLFVRGSTAANNAAIHNLRSYCTERFVSGAWTLEVVDLQDAPEMAKRHEVLLTPMLMFRSGQLVRKIVGDMRDEAQVDDALRVDGTS